MIRNKPKKFRLRNNEHLATTNQILKRWSSGGIMAVNTFLSDEKVAIFKDSWGEKIKKLLQNPDNLQSVNEEIKFVYSSINRNNIKNEERK